MNKLENPEYLEISKEFNICKLYLDRIFANLYDRYDSLTSLNSKKVGIYKHVKKLLPCFDILYEVSKTNSLQSLKALERMIIDNYAILYLLTSHSSKEEQDLRYYLYLLDGANTVAEILDDHLNESPTGIPHDVKKTTYEARDSNDNTIKELKKIIEQINSGFKADPKIIKNKNWKFINAVPPKGGNCYSWPGLYENAKIPSRLLESMHKYSSQFVHGLGVSLMFDNNSNLAPNINLVLELGRVVQTLIMKILLTEFSDETKSIYLPENLILFMNDNWNNENV